MWDALRLNPSISNEELFIKTLETYGSRCFMTELINAAMQTGSEFLVAPYFSTPQLVYLFREKMVQAVIGSLCCLMYQYGKGTKTKDSGPEDLT